TSAAAKRTTIDRWHATRRGAARAGAIRATMDRSCRGQRMQLRALLRMNYHYRTNPGARMERLTRQRDAIRSAIRASHRPLTPREVLQAARTSVQALGLATVYRTLKLLVDQGQVQAIHLPGESPRYESAASGHHHHFRCTACDRVFDVPGCPGDM